MTEGFCEEILWEQKRRTEQTRNEGRGGGVSHDTAALALAAYMYKMDSWLIKFWELTAEKYAVKRSTLG